jgi:hypothetical protein
MNFIPINSYKLYLISNLYWIFSSLSKLNYLTEICTWYMPRELFILYLSCLTPLIPFLISFVLLCPLINSTMCPMVTALVKHIIQLRTWRWRQYVPRNVDTHLQVHTVLLHTIQILTSSAQDLCYPSYSLVLFYCIPLFFTRYLRATEMLL